MDDYQLQFKDYYTGEMLTLGGDRGFCSVRFDGIGSAELISSERAMPSENGISFGREYLGKRVWTIQGGIKGYLIDEDGLPIVEQYVNGQPVYMYDGRRPSSPAAAWDEMSKIVRAWDYAPAKSEARAVTALYVKRPGREEMIAYGRPDRIDPDPTLSHAGFITYSATFRQSDPKMYSKDKLPISPLVNNQLSKGGLLYTTSGTATPLVFTDDKLRVPFATAEFSTVESDVVVGGDVPTPAVIKFVGPSTRPQLRLIGPSGGYSWVIALETSVESNQSVTIDPRIWARTVLRNDGTNMAGRLNSPRMGELLVSPGVNRFEYTSTGLDSTSRCEIELRNAWGSP